jgi:PAS domain S-box-containing protein
VDVTEPRVAQAAVRDSEAKFRALVEQSPDGIVLVDAQTQRLAYFNDRACQSLGFTRDEFRNLRVQDLEAVETPVDTERHIAEIIRRGEDVFETKLRAKDGELREYLMRIRCVSVAGTDYLLGVWQDITERKRAEQALRESEERFRSLFEEARDGILLADPDTKQLVMANRAICTMLGYSRKQFEQLRVHDIHQEADLPYVLDRFEKLAKGELRVAVDVPMKRKDGHVFYADVSAAPVLLKGQHFLMGQFRDVTDRRRAEEALREMAKTLERRVEERTRELKEKNAELDAFASSVSHDLRAPLRAMEGFANALIDDYADRLDTDGREYCEHIADAAQRMDELINDLLAYSRLGRTELSMQAVSLDRAIRAAIGRLKPEIDEKQASVVVEGSLPDVMAHYSTLVQISANLISNAVKFVAPDVRPEVRIWAEPRDGSVRLWVEDNGIGLDDEHHDLIFQVFTRLHGIESYPGSGIGLAIVHRAVDRLGGRIGIESHLDEGSRFWVEFGSPERG